MSNPGPHKGMTRIAVTVMAVAAWAWSQAAAPSAAAAATLHAAAGDGYLRICTDGPVFSPEEIRF